MVLVPSCILLLQYLSLVTHFTYGTTTGYDDDVITFVSESHQRGKSEAHGIRNKADKRRQANSPPAWWNEHPQTRNRPFSTSNAYRPQIACHSCMSGYLENQFVFITSLYKKPLAFTEKCDENNFDSQYLRTKNCTDACVTLMMNDKVGGRRRIGFMRGCLSDILHYNRTAVRIYDHSSSSSVMGGGTNGRSGSSSHCSRIRLRDLFISSDRYAFDTHDFVKLCACLRPLCNSAAKTLSGQTMTMMTLFTTFLIWFLTHSWQYGYALHLSGSDMIYHTNDQKLNFERWNTLIRYQCEYKMSSKCTIPNNESNPSHTKHRLKTKCSISEKYISH